jgi:hypothetical protein
VAAPGPDGFWCPKQRMGKWSPWLCNLKPCRPPAQKQDGGGDWENPSAGFLAAAVLARGARCWSHGGRLLLLLGLGTAPRSSSTASQLHCCRSGTQTPLASAWQAVAIAPTAQTRADPPGTPHRGAPAHRRKTLYLLESSMGFSVVTGLNEFRAPYRPHSARSAGAAAQRGVSILRPPPARRWRSALRGVPAIAAPSPSQQRWQGGGHALATIGALRTESDFLDVRFVENFLALHHDEIQGHRRPGASPATCLRFEVPEGLVRGRIVTAPVPDVPCHFACIDLC